MKNKTSWEQKAKGCILFHTQTNSCPNLMADLCILLLFVMALPIWWALRLVIIHASGELVIHLG